jgi:hypothetical protein
MEEPRTTAAFAEMSRTMRRVSTGIVADGGVPELFGG